MFYVLFKFYSWYSIYRDMFFVQSTGPNREHDWMNAVAIRVGRGRR